MKRMIKMTLILLLVGMAVVVAVPFLKEKEAEKKSEKEFENIQESVAEKKDKTMNVTKLKGENEDCIGYLEVPGTTISYPVMQTRDNPDFYLNHDFYKNILDKYSTLRFIRSNGALDTTTVVEYITETLCSYGLKNTPKTQEVAGIKIYPVDYFCPMDYETGKITITDNTVSIHRYAKSWHGKKEKLYYMVSKILGKKSAKFISAIWKLLHK